MPVENTTDITAVRAKLPTIVTMMFIVASIVTSYVATAAKLDATQLALTQLQESNVVRFNNLSAQIGNLEERSRGQERLIIELTTTLRVKGIIR